MNTPALPEGILAVRRGPGANCSSIGSVIDLLFASAVLAGVVYAAIAASLGDDRRATDGDSGGGGGGEAPKRDLHRRAMLTDFGAWIRDDDATLVAVDRKTARALGLDGGARWQGPQPTSIEGSPPAPLEVHVSVTSKCPATCSGCYLDAGPSGAHVDEGALLQTLDAVAEAGAFTVAFGGGEPLTHPALAKFAAHARARGLTPVVTTSGIGLTRERARELAAFAQVNVSYDGAASTYEEVRGFDGAHVAERAIAMLRAEGIPVGVNVVLTRVSFGDDGATLLHTCARAASLGVHEVQLLRYKPQGRAASLSYLTTRLSRAQVDALPAAITSIVDAGALSVRIDCALVSLLSTSLASPTSLAALQALGVMGCEAGSALASVKVDGRVAPCSFVDASALLSTSLREGWSDDATMARFRAHPSSASAPCDDCPIRAVCRGGCKVVSAHLLGDGFAPDPECPRVISHARA